MYCTGDLVDEESAAEIPAVEEGEVYDLVTLKSLALSHARALAIERYVSFIFIHLSPQIFPLLSLICEVKLEYC